MITGDLDRELAAALAALAADGQLPAAAARLAPGGTWRPAPGDRPAAFGTSLAFELARLNGRSPAEVAAVLAPPLGALPWIQAAEPSGDGYLTITVTPQALAASAARMAAAGLSCAHSTILRGTAAAVRPWPDLAAARSWPEAWQDQADTMSGRLAQAAGATVSITSEWKRGGLQPPPARDRRSPVYAAVAYLGVSSVRYRLARTVPGSTAQLAKLSEPRARTADPLYIVQQAHADAASTLRWAADLHLARVGLGERPMELLTAKAELELLGLLAWLPVRVAAAACRHRPDEVPRYLEQVAEAWMTCRQAAPALPFGGRAAPDEPELASARLVLADAARAALAAGLALTGITASERM
ncbi:MAG TPA: DALR anticodon-binding domain-containing protein [Streptosporangiaceae bacterium]|nr:DALR anticodon-binding domain-containing protein [Streptosporangiaceae bacterium]